MNDRLWELYDEAVQSVSDDAETLEECMQTFTEKIAQLIVKECAELAGCNAHVSGFALGDLIKEHFGVDND